MYITRQDHIDRLVSKVEPCYAHKFYRHGEMVVLFTDGSWVCSSGHCSEGDAPVLRTPDRDPVEWVKANAEKMARSLAIVKCPGHEDESFAQAKWGEEGHLWGSGPSGRTLALCLPRGDLHV